MIKDKFDAVRSAMILSQSPVMCCSYWYKNWFSEVLPVGIGAVSGHAYQIEGWRQINGEPYFIVEAWLGHKLLMSREVFNSAMSAIGTSTWVLSTSTIDAKRTKTLYQLLSDALANLAILLKKLWITNNQPVIITPTNEVIPNPVIIPPVIEKYLWNTNENIRHSIRVIGNEEGLTVIQKDLACDIPWCESRYVIRQRGIIDPRDRGLFQWNSHYHPEITDEIAFNPEKNARLGCKAIKAGKVHAYWSASEPCWNKNHKYDQLLS